MSFTATGNMCYLHLVYYFTQKNAVNETIKILETLGQSLPSPRHVADVIAISCCVPFKS